MKGTKRHTQQCRDLQDVSIQVPNERTQMRTQVEVEGEAGEARGW